MMKLEKINSIINCCFPKDWQDKAGLLRRYSFSGSQGNRNAIIYRADGSQFHGGLTDRWKGMVSLYALAKAINRDFRIYYTFPFRLEDFLIPNEYNWVIDDADITQNIRNVTLRRVIAEPTPSRMLNIPQNKQIHCYANRDWLESINATFGTSYKWGDLFRELFTPSPLLANAVNQLQAVLPTNYIAVAFRMQNLLGDYKEYQYQPATAERQNEIITVCKEYLKSLYNTVNLSILVTSDSNYLTAEVSQLPYVFTNKGKAAHVDTVRDADETMYLKSFVDFYALAGAKAIYAPTTKEMYHSDFPKYAAKLGGCTFSRIEL